MRPLTAPFRLTSAYEGDARAGFISYAPRAVALPGGGFAAGWQTIKQRTSGGATTHYVSARSLGPTGSLYPESILAFGMPPWQGWPQNTAIAADGTGGYLALWDDTIDIWVQPFGPDAASRQAAWCLVEQQGEQAVGAEMAGNAHGDLAIAWQTQNLETKRFRLLAQVFRADGTAVTPRITVPVKKPRWSGIDHRIGIDAQGRFVVVWRDGWSLRGQRFDSSGAALGTSFSIADRTATKAIPVRLAVAPDGRFAVAWGDSSITLRTYTAAAAPVGPQRFLTGKLIDLATDRNGNLALAALEFDGTRYRLQIHCFNRRLAALGQVLIPRAGPALAGGLALSDSGTLLVVWGGSWITWPSGADQAPLLAQLWKMPPYADRQAGTEGD